MQWNDGLSGTHLEIAASDSNRIGILAGPGTGKTGFGLMRRVARLLASGVPGERILLISFTRVAAADLRDKVAQLGLRGVENVQARTLHGYCFSLLQKEAVLKITGRAPRILLAHEVDLMLRDIGDDFGDIHGRRKRLAAFTAGWARQDSDYPGVPKEETDRAFQARVVQWLREHRAMLIGEVVPLAYSYLRDNPASAEHYAFDHIIADEYQDLNQLEQALLDCLAESSSLCIAGDDDQSIYSMRYANPTGINQFIEREDVQTYSLNVCGRCPPQILDMANSLMGQAPGRNKVDTDPLDPEMPAAVSVVQWPDLESEVEGTVAAIAADIQRERRAPGDILVLTNWRRIGERIRSALTDLDIPARSFFTEEELSSDEARSSLALLRLLADETDLPALRVLMGLEEGTGRSAAYQRLLAHSRANDMPVTTVLEKLARGEQTPGLLVSALVHRFTSAQSRLEELRTLDLPPLVETLFPQDNPALSDLRDVALAALPEAEGVHGLLRKVVESVTQDEVPQSPDFVRVMSLHKSKGLTSPAVFVVGAVEGILPTVPPQATDGERVAALAEGRRLFYVAVTRAAHQLVITSAASMPMKDAKARGVAIAKGSTRNTQDGLFIKTITTSYVGELGRSCPRPVLGPRWLESY